MEKEIQEILNKYSEENNSNTPDFILAQYLMDCLEVFNLHLYGKKSMPNIKIKKNEEQPESVELLAQSIIQVAEGFEKFKNSSLSQRALIVLLQDMIGVTSITKGQIKFVLEALPRLKAWYIKK